MNIDERIAAFQKLGNYLSAIDKEELAALVNEAKNENSWFTDESIRMALTGVRRYLDGAVLSRWTSHYSLERGTTKTVAVVMAGNIPLVGFHDFISVLVGGHAIQAKLSSKDSFLIRKLAEKLIVIEPRFGDRISFVDQLKNFDAVIATGSDNSARYFEYYFGKYPHIIRKNRTSCAVLNGKETTDDLRALGEDVFTYFGLGCRNVSKLFLPRNFAINRLFDSWQEFEKVLLHHKYHNNYDYQKSILLLNKASFLDSGFVLLEESEKLVSPISVLYYERYDDEGSLALKLTSSKDKIQCIVGNTAPAKVRFGEAQSPEPWDYADQIDTLKFLESLN